MSMMILDALWSIGDRLDSQVIGRTEDLGGCTGESSPCLFALDLVWLILRFGAPNFVHRSDEKTKFACQKVLSRSQLVRFPRCIVSLSIALGWFSRVFLERKSRHLRRRHLRPTRTRPGGGLWLRFGCCRHDSAVAESGRVAVRPIQMQFGLLAAGSIGGLGKGCLLN